MSYSPIPDKTGIISKIVFLGTDITNQKNAETEMSLQSSELLEKKTQLEDQIETMKKMQNELQYNKREVDALLNVINSTSLVIYLDTKGRVLNCNALMLEENKLKREDVINKHYSELVKNTHKEKSFEKGWSKILTGENVQFTNREQTEDDVVITTESFIPVIDDHGKVYKIIHVETKTDFEK